MDQDRRAVDFNCFIMRGDREGIKGRWSGYEFHLSYFSRLKLNGSLIPETSAHLILIDCLTRHQIPRAATSKKTIQNIAIATAGFSLDNTE